jgi:histidine triad (HIT) family protein
MDCIFCKIIAGTIPSVKILENEQVIVIKDIKPKAPIHYLIIPKKHSEDIRSWDKETLPLASEIFAVAQQLSQQLNNTDFRLIISNGHDAGQRVFHAHVHFLAGGKFSE